MAEPKPEFLYAVRADNEKLKDAAKEAGVPIKFNREVGAFEIKTDGMDAGAIKAAKGALADYVGKDAKAAWKADREVGLAEKESLRDEARKRESTTKEPKPAKKVVKDEGILVYPAHSQKDEFRKLVVETQSESRYQKARGNESAHYVVKTTVPEKFAAFVGKEAKERFLTEHAAMEAGTKPQNVNTAVEQLREQARGRAGAAFMAQYHERGFRLADREAGAANHQKQLNEMADATVGQLLSVKKVSMDLLQPLRDKEAQMRADAAGIPVEQVKAMSWSEQKNVGAKDGQPIGLTGDEFKLSVQLARGIGAIERELQARGVGREKPAKAQEQSKAQATGQSAAKPKAKAVSSEQSADETMEVMAAFANRGKGAGR